jgi:DNA-directed RNA polymerase specialized sigma24 family protein
MRGFGYSYKEIAKFLERDHSNVLRIHHRYRNNPYYAEELSFIQDAVG